MDWRVGRKVGHYGAPYLVLPIGGICFVAAPRRCPRIACVAAPCICSPALAPTGAHLQSASHASHTSSRARGTLLLSLCVQQNSGISPAQPMLFCSRLEKANYYPPWRGSRMSRNSLEDRILEKGQQILQASSKQKKGFLSIDLDERLMEWATTDDALKVQLFRFVDVFPMLKTPKEIVSHLQEYLGAPGRSFSMAGKLGLNIASASGIAAKTVAATVRSQITGMAHKFIAGSNVQEALQVVERLRKQNMAFSMDILGEATVSDVEADTYRNQYMTLIRGLAEKAGDWEDIPIIDIADKKLLPKVNVSIKLSSLYPQFEPADPDGAAFSVKERLRPILNLAKELGVFVNFDMEHSAIKDVILKIYREIIMEPEYRNWANVGIAMQAYLRNSEKDVRELIDVIKQRGTPATVRLVKGAYWDYETVFARQKRWPIPVWTEKWETDACFERCSEMLLKAHPHIRLAVASHNIRNLAHAICMAETLNLPKDAIEFQMLYGMGEHLKQAVVEQGLRLRVYTPYGDLIPGMAYLVRRLLENTTNESFLRQSFSEHIASEKLLRNPAELAKAANPDPIFENDSNVFPNAPERNYSLAEDRQRMRDALAKVKKRFGQFYPLVIDGKNVATEKELQSLNPARPSEVVGRVAITALKEVQLAIDAAKKALPMWRNHSADKRAEYLFKAAEIVEQERDELAAWQVFEVGKNWREADADICETIDYLHYYAKEMIGLAKPRRLRVPGEINAYFYQPKGIAVIIAPWNFPMAICAGMTVASLVAGNTALVKPSERSSVIAAKFVDIMRRTGLPDGVVNFIPGLGTEIGDFIVQHPEIHLIAFTGSRATGCRINKLASDVAQGQDHLKKVIAEMGGKNAIIIDSDANLDEAVLGTIQSAFGYQGQKCSACSRVILLEAIYDHFVSRLIETARSLHIGAPENPGNLIGPVIDARAYESIRRYVEIGKSEATLAYEGDVSHLPEGYFIGPAIFTDVAPDATIAREEIFGPVLSVFKAKSLDEAIALAMNAEYALTGGFYSRSPANIIRMSQEFRVGNLYINRKCTGAIVARQPFGGLKMSGIGSKAGGPDYLLQFMDPRVVTENTLRSGFAPETTGSSAMHQTPQRQSKH
jgi:RHH-type transcriptional regulator, proline utilization regulon repressor / proline dehydrogenase / delta 1-pyrroline-5-carboxylate dehydrogenase